LIWNIPIPIVHNSDVAFPSLYPYVDFVDKQFAWNSRSDRYEYLPQADRKVVEPEIWHGVVNPAVWRDWNGESDIQKIKNFLKKTEDFYAWKGKFAPRSTPPRVFYYDGFAESKSVNTKNLFLYGLTMSNTENLAYKRFTKYLLQDLNGIVDQFNTTADADTKSIVAWLGITSSKDEIDANTVKIMPDVQSRLPIQSILKNFKSIINETTLADAYWFVRNAGRYSSGSSVRVDLSPISMTIADEVAQSTLKQTNIAIMSSIDQAILNSWIVRRIPIFDELHASYSDPINLATENLKSYSAFYLGQSSKSITTPQMCSFTRGSSGYVGTFGRSELVEANLGYDVSTTEKQLDVLKSDTQQLVAMKGQSYSCFDTSWSPKLDSYWWGNSILRVVNSSNPSELLNESPGATRIKWMTQSIVSIGWMKETTRLPAASIADCTNERYIYALRNPEILHVNVFNRLGGTQQCLVGVPSEWNTGIWACSWLVGNKTPRYTCISQNESLVNIPSFAESLDKFTHSTCLSGSVYLDGTSIQTANSICMNNAAEGTSATVNRWDDMTTYENIYFHTIPSILHHISPTDEELSAAIENGATPSIPVDMVRYLEFYTPKGNIARIDYPNFFTLSGTDIASLRASLKDLSEKTWQKIIDQENSTTLNPKDQIAQKFLLQWSPSISILDWNNYISDELLLKVLQSRNWLNPDVTVKYKQSIETTLSYSHEYPNSDVTKNPPKIPTLSDSYDIAYLGLTSFFPQSNTSSEADTITSDYNAKFAQIKALNYSEPSENLDDPYSSSSQCGSPDGVDLFQWPSAISCWVHSLSMPRISAGSCGPWTIWIEKASSAVTLPTGLLSDIQWIQDFYSGGQLVYNIERTNISFHDSITLQYNYRKNGIPLVLPEGSSIDIHILSWSTSDGKQIPVSEIHKYIDSAPNSSKITDWYAKFVLTAGEKSANIDVRASLSIHFPDGSESKIESWPLHLRISDEYVDINSRNWITIDSTGTGEVMLDFSVKNHSGSLSTLNYPLSIDIFDDVDGTHLSSWTVSQTSIYTLSSIYTKKIWNYRILVQDASWRAWEITLAVRSGVFSQVSFEPISRVVLKGAETYAALHLLDNLGNPIWPDLHSVDIETENGFIIAQDGTKKQTYHVDLMEPILPLRLSWLNTGDFHIKIKIDNVIVWVYSLLVVPSAQMRLIRSNQPSVDGWLQKMMIRIEKLFPGLTRLHL